MACPKASWVTYKPFDLGKPNVLKPGTISKAKSCFLGVPLLLKTSPRPSREPDSRPPARWWVWGPKCGPRGQKYQSCVLKNHAENTGQYSKRSHMLQVMAQNHFEALAAKSGPKSRGQEACVDKEEQGPFLKSGFFSQTPVCP